MSKKQILKLVLSLVGVAAILLAVALGISYNYLPHALQLLPIPLGVVGIIVLLILKTTGKTLDARPLADGGETPANERESEPATGGVAGETGRDAEKSEPGRGETAETAPSDAPTPQSPLTAPAPNAASPASPNPPRNAASPYRKNVPVTVKRKIRKK